MTLWLAFKIFGNGHGLAVPCFPEAFYWYKDRFYTWIGGFGAQLYSFEWFAPPAGTRREIFGKEFVVFGVHRRWLLVSVSWAVNERLDNIEALHKLKEILPS